MTESEVRQGILESSNAATQCCWINRNIWDLMDHLEDERAPCFIDVKPGNPEIDQDAQDLLQRLKDDIVLRNLPMANMKSYDVKWTANGIDPKSSDEHAQYIERMCGEFESLLKELISEAIRMRNETDVSDSLYEETVQHLSFCQSKCGTFYGRGDILEQCRDYLLSKRMHPLVIYGESGCGKTSVVSMVAEQSRQWLGEQSNLIIRYIGTTPDTSLVRLLLRSVCQQICILYDEEPSEIRQVGMYWVLSVGTYQGCTPKKGPSKGAPLRRTYQGSAVKGD